MLRNWLADWKEMFGPLFSRRRQRRVLAQLPAEIQVLEDRTLLTGEFGFAVALGDDFGDFGFDVAVDADGNVYATGSFVGTVDFDPGSSTFNLTSDGDRDVFVAKYSAAGALIWAVSFDGTGNDQGLGIAVDGTGVYTTGTFRDTVDFDPGPGIANRTSNGLDDVFVTRLNAADGTFVWAAAFGDTSVDEGYGIAVDDTGVYTTGEFRGTVDFDPGLGIANRASIGQNDVFVSKLNKADGSFAWAVSFGGATSDRGNDIAVNGTGVYTTGSFNDTVDFDPGSGVANRTSSGLSDVFVSKLNTADGAFTWAATFGGTSSDIGNGISVDDTGVYTTGQFRETADFDPGPDVVNRISNGDFDMFVSRLNAADGSFDWAASFGDTSADEGYGITVDSAGVYTTGYFAGTVDFDPGPGTTIRTSNGSGDVFVSRLNAADGSFAWVASFGGSLFDTGLGIAVDGANIYTTGYFGDTVDFDPGSDIALRTSNGGDDVFLSQLRDETAVPPPDLAIFDPATNTFSGEAHNGQQFPGGFVDGGIFAQFPVGETFAFVTEADVNDDGVTDYIGLTDTDAAGTEFFVAESDGAGGYSVSSWGNPGIAASQVAFFDAGDFDGDDNADILIFTTGDFGTGQVGQWFTFLSDPVNDQFIPSNGGGSASGNQWSISAAFVEFFLGDFNSDNLIDVGAYSKGFFGENSAQVFLAFSNGTTLSAPINAADELPNDDLVARVAVGDFNGDELDDVSVFADDGNLGPNARWLVGLNDGLGAAGSLTFSVWDENWSLAGVWSALEIGDFNGDGSDDVVGRSTLVGFDTEQNGLFVGLSNGTSAFSTTLWEGGLRDGENLLKEVIVSDFNNDGVDDVLSAFLDGELNVAESLAMRSADPQNAFETIQWGTEELDELDWLFASDLEDVLIPV